MLSSFIENVFMERILEDEKLETEHGNCEAGIKKLDSKSRQRYNLSTIGRAYRHLIYDFLTP